MKQIQRCMRTVSKSDTVQWNRHLGAAISKNEHKVQRLFALGLQERVPFDMRVWIISHRTRLLHIHGVHAATRLERTLPYAITRDSLPVQLHDTMLSSKKSRCLHMKTLPLASPITCSHTEAHDCQEIAENLQPREVFHDL